MIDIGGESGYLSFHAVILVAENVVCLEPEMDARGHLVRGKSLR